MEIVSEMKGGGVLGFFFFYFSRRGERRGVVWGGSRISGVFLPLLFFF